jgi:serine/threonine protein kinase/Tfp pilus assembly protein PilF
MIEDLTPGIDDQTRIITPGQRNPSTDRGFAADNPSCPVAVAIETGPAPATTPTNQPRKPRALPAVGEHFLGFELVSELGRGAVGCVFLARQRELASRLVVVKVGMQLSNECQKLAKLQHPNIVPIYSFHHEGAVHALCMPYRGPITLAHLVARLRSENLQTLNGKSLTTVIDECRRHRQPLPITAPPTAPETSDPVADDPNWIRHRGRIVDHFASLRRLDYIDAVLTIIRRMAEGLQFAHEQQIVHSDLKPANVVIADDGTPQLIDFGIAHDQSKAHDADLRLGGTRPYMSPEQLASFANSDLQYDERSDLYAIGVILFELLTGQLPFAANNDRSPMAIERDRMSRFSPLPSARSLNKRIPPGVEAIVHKCLAPDVRARYQSAKELIEDIDRQLKRRALKHAPNPSKSELAAKYLRRNRWPILIGAILTATCALIAVTSSREAKNRREVARLEAASACESFQADAREAEFCFGLEAADPTQHQRAWQLAKKGLARLGAWDDERWFERKAFQSLDPNTCDHCRVLTFQLMLLMANSQADQAKQTRDSNTRQSLLRAAMEWNRRAELTHPTGSDVRVVWIQRSNLAKLGGDIEAEHEFQKRAESLPRTPSDLLIEGRQLLLEGRIRAADRLLASARESAPQSFWAAYYSALCDHRLGRDQEAAAGYDVCVSLQPRFFGVYYNRGLVRLRSGRLAEAEADFDRAIEARPDWADPYFQRALTQESQKRYAAAIEDLNKAKLLGFTHTTIHFVMARIYGLMGDKVAAAREFAEGVRITPTDERGWLARAQARIFSDPVAALHDYDEVLSINPKLIPALQGKAHILSRLGRTREAIDALTVIISVNAESADAWSGRGVLYARLGNREAALSDAHHALRNSERAATKYQVAGIYALTSRTHPGDRHEAMAYLDSALRSGFGFELIEGDRDLDPIRSDVNFGKTIDAARQYRVLVQKTQ